MNIIDSQFGRFDCSRSEYCRSQVEANTGKNARWFNGETIAAIISLKEFNCYAAFRNKIKRLYKGNVIRDARKSEREGFYCKEFNYRLFVPDIQEIHTSAPIRQGKPMKETYLKSVEDMGGPPDEYMGPLRPTCPVHYQKHYGCFVSIPLYGQGEVVVNEKLLAYIGFLRRGNLAFYSMIIGHDRYLKYGVMYFLHFHIMKELLSRQRNTIEFIIYAGMNQGADGLKLWKKKAGFEPATLELKDDA